MRVIYLILIISVFGPAWMQSNTLSIEITNIKEVQGNMHIGIYDKSDNFPKVNGEYKKLVIPVKGSKLIKSIKIPSGNYAISVYHDKNADNQCNQNKLKIPLEAFGFSNNVIPFLAIPTFTQCKFKLDKERKVSIRLLQPLVSE